MVDFFALTEHDIPRHKVVIMTKCFFVVSERPELLAGAYGESMAKARDYVNLSGRTSLSRCN